MDALTFTPEEPSFEELDRKRKELSERVELYRQYGHDREKAIGFVVDCAEPIEGPVLDIGTGRGFTAVELARRGHKVVSVDISSEALQDAYIFAKAEGVADRVEFRLVDGGKLPFEDGSFKLVAIVNVLHHLGEFEETLKEIARVLVPDGRMLLADFTEEGFEIIDKLLTDEGRGHDRAGNHTIDDVVEVMHRYGMQCIMRDTRFNEYVLLARKVS